MIDVIDSLLENIQAGHGKTDRESNASDRSDELDVQHPSSPNFLPPPQMSRIHGLNVKTSSQLPSQSGSPDPTPDVQILFWHWPFLFMPGMPGQVESVPPEVTLERNDFREMPLRAWEPRGLMDPRGVGVRGGMHGIATAVCRQTVL